MSEIKKEAFYMFGYMDEELVQRFIVSYNNLLNGNVDSLDIYIDSEGGLNCVRTILFEMISLEKDSITIIATGHLSSNAFWLFFTVPCECILTPEVIGLAHQTQRESSINASMKIVDADPGSAARTKLAEIKKHQDSFIDFLEFTPKEKKVFQAGKDLWFSNARLREFLEIKNKKLGI